MVHGYTVYVVVAGCTCVAVLLPCPSVWWLLLRRLAECYICVQLLCKLLCICSVGRFGDTQQTDWGSQRGFDDLYVCWRRGSWGCMSGP